MDTPTKNDTTEESSTSFPDSTSQTHETTSLRSMGSGPTKPKIPTWEEESESETFTPDPDDQETIQGHLQAWPGDYAGAAKKVGVSREVLVDYVERNPHLFDKLDEEYYDRLESLCRIKALGRPLPDGYEDFDFGRGFKILERGRAFKWAGTQKARDDALRARTDEATGEIDDVMRSTKQNKAKSILTDYIKQQQETRYE